MISWHDVTVVLAFQRRWSACLEDRVVGLFGKKGKQAGTSPRGGVFAQMREAQQLMQEFKGGGDLAAIGERITSVWAGDVQIDKSKAVSARAKVVAYEGHDYVEAVGATHTAAKEHATYIVDVHPEQEPAFRTEVKGWVHVSLRPQVGDVINVLYEPGTTHVQLDLADDPRYDWDQKMAAQRAQKEAERQALLQEPPSPDPLP
jgi:hypothetical protein